MVQNIINKEVNGLLYKTEANDIDKTEANDIDKTEANNIDNSNKNLFPFISKDKHFLLDSENSKLYALSKLAYKLYVNELNLGDDEDVFDYSDINNAAYELDCVYLDSKNLSENIFTPQVENETMITFLWLGVSHHCNLSCSYCFL